MRQLKNERDVKNQKRRKDLIGFKGIQVSDSFRKVRKGNQVSKIKKRRIKIRMLK